MRLPLPRRAKAATSGAAAASDVAALSAVSALDFPRADGPTNAEVSLAPGATSDAAAASPPGPRLPALQSIAVRMVGVLVLVTLWSLAIGYALNYHGLKKILASETRDALERSGSALGNALELNAANLEALVRSQHEDAGFAREIEAASPAAGARKPADASALQERADRLRAIAGAHRIDIVDAGGRLLAASAGAPAAPSPSVSAEAIGRAVSGKPWLGVERAAGHAVVRAAGPVIGTRPGSGVAGAVLAEFHVTRAFIRDTVRAADVEVTLLSKQGVLARTSQAADEVLPATAFERWAAAAAPLHVALADGAPALARPLRLGETPVLLVLREPEHMHAVTLARAGDRMMLFALLTISGAVLLGLLVTRWLIRPIQALTTRAEELSLRHAGRAVSRAGSEFDRMLRAFNAMTDALLAHSERLKKAHLNELQNSLELQRQYALMRLLRGLAMAANECDSVEDTLKSALHEIGEYLDWPIGRVALLPQDVHPDSRPPESFWFVRDRARFAGLIEESERRPIVRSVNGLLGRAYVSGMPHWVSDLSRLIEWSRRDLAMAAGLQSGVVIPVTAHGHVTAFIEFFSEHRVEATVEMLELIEAIGAELSRVAERHRAERELRASEAEARRMALVAANTASLVTVCDAAGRIEWVNASFLRVTGYGRDEVIGRQATQLLRGPDTDAEVAAEIDARMNSGAGVKNVEIVNHAKDGTPYWVEVEIQPVYSGAGVLTNFVAIENDVTQRKTDQRRLAESASHFQALFDDSPVPALIQGPDDRLTHANRALARMLGTTPESLIGRDPNEFTHPDDIEPANQLRRFFERKVGEAIEFERRYVRADGAVLWARVHCVRLAPKGLKPYVVAVVENFTDIKAKEHALREAKDAAEAASRAKSQFLANMSHEIRTPMNGVLGMTELLLGTPLTDRQKRFADAVYRSGEALLDIINDILDLSKIEAGRLELDASDFSVRSLVEDVFELLAPRAHQKRIELAYRVAHDVPAALAGDPLRVRQVLTNLVGNAIKFTERGEVVLDVGVVQTDARRVRLRFAVRDTGIGMKAEAVTRLFSVFMQADQSMSRRYGGTGLGLAISKHLVELMGGAIAVDSRLGEGSTFHFEIPLARGDESAIATSSTPIARERLAGRRVLVVDDNPTNRNIIDEHLRNEGMECACAENGMTALEILHAAAGAGTPFDAAIVDLKMPLMDGVTLAQRIRADERIAGIRLVMLTSLSSGTETQAAQDAGIEICLVKPVRQQQLVQAIATLLSPADAADQSPVMREAGVRLAGARVLLVEDNPVNQELARAMLQEFGCGVRLAGNGREALEALSREVFDAVLMDCQMPEMDGFEAVRLFRTGNVGRPTLATPTDVAVIALTANVLPGDAERCRAAGFSDYLPKPFRQAQLAQMLSRYVRRDAAATVSADSVAAAARSAVAIDTTVIERIRDMERRGAARLLARLIETYLETAERLMNDLRTALDAGDAAAARQAAHTLKSSSANLGAHEFSGRCADMEHLARGGQLAAAREAWPALAQAHAGAAACLRELEAQPARLAAEPAVGAAA